MTLDDYVEECDQVFKAVGLKVKVVTPMVIADFQTFLEPVLDSKLSRLHKGTVKLVESDISLYIMNHKHIQIFKLSINGDLNLSNLIFGFH